VALLIERLKTEKEKRKKVKKEASLTHFGGNVTVLAVAIITDQRFLRSLFYQSCSIHVVWEVARFCSRVLQIWHYIKTSGLIWKAKFTVVHSEMCLMKKITVFLSESVCCIYVTDHVTCCLSEFKNSFTQLTGPTPVSDTSNWPLLGWPGQPRPNFIFMLFFWF